LTNPTAGHTSATGMGSDAQGLRDGDGLTSPSLTNLYEGLHGNGIMRLGDGARGDSLRNSVVANTPGYLQIGAAQGEVKVYGGYCVLDGVLYQFANGPGSYETFIVGTTGAGANHSGDLPSVPGSNSDVYVVVYLVGRNTPEAHVMYEMGTPAAPSSGTPLIPNRFLSTPSISGNTDLNHQTTVLGVIRYSMAGGSANVTASLSGPVIHDRRTFLRNSPLYLTPMTKGGIGDVAASNALTNPDAFFSSPEDGDLTGSTFGAIWQTHREDTAGGKHGVILAAIPGNLDTTPVTGVHVLGPDRLENITTSADITFTFDEANIWVITTDANRTIAANGVFPAGHVVDIYHKAGAHTLTFDPTVGGHGATPINVSIAVGESARFVYDGTDWHQVIAASSSFPSSSGASGLVQLSDGAGGFTSDADLSWDSAAGELTVNGKLTVTGLIDPTGLELDPQAANPGGVAANTLWLDSGASNRPKIGANAVLRASDNISELTNDSAFVDAAGAAAAAPVASVNTQTGAVSLDADDLADGTTKVMMTAAERTKLTGVETGATADQTDAEIRAAVEAATDSNVFTDADHTKLDGIAAGATANDTDANLRDRATHTGTQAASTIGSGTFADARIAQSNVTQHQAALSITESQISDLQGYLLSETNDLTASVTWANVPDANITQSSVTQHQAALTVDDSQVTAAASATNYTPSAATVEGHLSGIDTALASAGSYTDAQAIAAVEGEAGLDFSTSTGDAIIENTVLDKDIILRVNDGGSSVDRLIIYGDNDPSFPNTEVKVAGSLLATEEVQTNSLVLGYGSSPTASIAEIKAYSSTEPMVFKTGTGSPERMRIATDGKVGIGTTPSQTLHVNGTIRQTVTSAVLVADANGDLTAASNLTDASYVAVGSAGADSFNIVPPGSPTDWTGPPPTSIEEAINRIASFVAATHGPIP